MKLFLSSVILFALSVAAAAAYSTVKRSPNSHAKNSQSDMINNYYSANCEKKFHQQLAEIKHEIKALKENLTGNGLFSKVKQQLSEVKEEMRALKENKTKSCSLNCLTSDVKQQLAGIKDEIRTLKENQTGGSTGNGVLTDVRQHLTEIKEEIRGLKRNSSGNHRNNCLSSEIKQHLAGIKNEIRMLRGNRTECPLGNVSRNCAEIYKSGVKTSGVYKIDPDGLGEFEVFCDQATAGGGWTVFQKRFDGSVDFYRGWDDYKRGFGNLTGEFWLGLDKIHRLTVSSSNKLRVDLEDVPGNTAFAEYSSFAVGNETEKYKLRVGGFSGTAGDSLSYHHGSPFATKDRDNNGCALTNKGAWWYKSCYKSSLNGQYMPGAIDKNPGMNWYYWKNSWISMKRTEMKIRPKRF
ncbi:PREDICTED: microfibril-associated glycoprotein 4-like isoform X1 [Acropora digitifera]|uniref:microfibril-associated glycoprotein 4-like isoform X1 n=1 Tax=Acropora digitifera TaxID=70779 RepID=UPI00077AB1F5|nr:PREDICTED: microfibril-associated glycoprotein 4-like isoform X1 [Acropora digitifera]